MGSMNSWNGNFMVNIEKYKWQILKYVSEGEHYFKFSETSNWSSEKIYGYN